MVSSVPHWFCLLCSFRLDNIRQGLVLSIDGSYSNPDLYGAHCPIVNVPLRLEPLRENVRFGHPQCGRLEFLDIGMTRNIRTYSVSL